MRGQGAKAGEGQSLGADRLAWRGEQAGHGDQRALRARTDQDLRRHGRRYARRQPVRACRAVGRGAARFLVSQQQVEAAACLQPRDPGPHARGQRRVVEAGRQVHAHVDLAAGCGVEGGRTLHAYEGALSDPAIHQPAPPRLGIGAADGREVDAQRLGQTPLWRQAHPVAQRAGRNVRGDRIRDREVERPIRLADRRNPRSGAARIVHSQNPPRYLYGYCADKTLHANGILAQGWFINVWIDRITVRQVRSKRPGLPLRGYSTP